MNDENLAYKETYFIFAKMGANWVFGAIWIPWRLISCLNIFLENIAELFIW